jgi:hypothetical protein
MGGSQLPSLDLDLWCRLEEHTEVLGSDANCILCHSTVNWHSVPHGSSSEQGLRARYLLAIY